VRVLATPFFDQYTLVIRCSVLGADEKANLSREGDAKPRDS
jgi:hypothetical protein